MGIHEQMTLYFMGKLYFASYGSQYLLQWVTSLVVPCLGTSHVLYTLVIERYLMDVL